MNKTIQFLSVGFLLVLGILASCKKKNDATPAPQITVDSVSSSSSKTMGYYGVAQNFTIYYSVTSSASLSKITYSESPTQDITKTIKPTGKITPDFTAFSTPTQYSASYVTSIPNNASSVDVTITAYDSKGLSSQLKFNARTFIDYTVTFGGSDNTANGPYLASTTYNNTYPDAQFSANASNIDVTYAQIASVPTFLSTQQRATLQTSKGSGSVSTFFKVSTLDISSVTAATLANLTASSTQQIALSTAGVFLPGTYEFVSPTTGAKGLIKVTTYNAGSQIGDNSSVFTEVKVVNTK